MILKKIGLILFLSLFFFACDKVYLDDSQYIFAKDTVKNINNSDTNLNVSKKVILLEFTGIRCVNCPDAHEIIHQLQNLYKDNFLAVSIHGTTLAIPVGEFANEPDLRTDEGNQIIEQFDINSIPIGMVDFFDKNKLVYKESWTEQVNQYVSEPPQVSFQINSCIFNNQIQTNILIQTTDNLEGDYNLCVYLVEDSIYTLQASNDGNIENYLQLNVFRKSLTNVWGDLVFSGQTPTNIILSKTYKTEIDTAWNIKNCRIVSFIYRKQDNKILNAETKHIIEE